MLGWGSALEREGLRQSVRVVEVIVEVPRGALLSHADTIPDYVSTARAAMGTPVDVAESRRGWAEESQGA